MFSFANMGFLNPQGIIALKERNLMVIAILLMLIVVIPVFVFTFYIVRKYRVDSSGAVKNTKTKYEPNWDHNRLIEGIWWGVPCVIILILSIITWASSHELNPYQPLESSVTPITVEVVALDWKWLFIYPQQGIASVNLVEFPAGTPINFQVTSDAPMNSFFIPQLGGQIYAMPGMSTQLHLEAFKPGTYNGLSANISGAGFSGMNFVAQSVSQADFDQWVASVKQGTSTLDGATYAALSAPSRNDPVSLYSSIDQNLYNDTVMKYMMPTASSTTQ